MSSVEENFKLFHYYDFSNHIQTIFKHHLDYPNPSFLDSLIYQASIPLHAPYSIYNMLLPRHQLISWVLLPFTWHKACHCAWYRSYLLPPFPCMLAERFLQSLLPCCLASVSLHSNIGLIVVVCSLYSI